MAEARFLSKPFTREELDIITDNFKSENLIGRTHFGELYKGVYRRAEVTVKLWGFINRPPVNITEETLSRNKSRLINEICFLNDPSICCRFCVPKLIGHYFDEEKSRMFAVVYDFASSDTLLNATTNDEFNWTQRIKVARDLAELLEFLHGREPPYRVCNIDPINIMLDKGREQMLIDFSLVTRKDRIVEDNMRDIDLIMNGFLDFEPLNGLCFVENDVYSFGLLLLGLISKHVHNHDPVRGTFLGDTINEWVVMEYRRRNAIDGSKSLAHHSFREEAGFDDGYATKVTELAMICLCNTIHWRPSMKLLARLLGNPLAPDYVDGITSDILLDGNGDIEKISLQDLEASAETFTNENMIGFTQFGALYKGAAKFHGYIVKTWGYFNRARGKIDERHLQYNWFRFKNEIKFLKNPPFESCSFPKLKAYFCDEEKDMFAVVYDLTTTDHDTLMNLIAKDDFTWTHRIEVALDLARVTEKLHLHNYMILDLDWSTIVLNKMWMPILVDFSLITTTNREAEQWQFKYYGRLLANGLHNGNIVSGLFEMGDDVHSFASILLGLISKQSDVIESTMSEWAANVYKTRSSGCSNMSLSLADSSFESQSGYDACSATIITKMALACLLPTASITTKKALACLLPTASCQPSIKVVVKALVACQSILKVKLNEKTYTGASDMPWEASKGFLTRFTEEDLNSMFSQKILIEKGNINIYLGRIPPDKYVTVKTWDCDSSMMDMQIFFSSLPEVRNSHRFPVLIGYHKSNSRVGLVYNFQAKGMLRSLVKDGKFTWAQRISVALNIAELLALFHVWKPLHLIYKIDAKHILLDKNFNPMLTEFSMVTNGNFCDTMDGTIGTTTSCHEESDDVRSFGVILSTLISKNEGPNCDSILLVHQSLEADPDYDVQLGERMVQLALHCLNTDLKQRPTMIEIINSFPRGTRMMV